ncbi:ectonucleoside triphosphate diphosphohydrolase 1-like [Paramacrobiotus metropolitanus]|uniref:ectonucleoside triphosphate diphosphohydrolase 1-like n=1 Tax=Paramacrobiotus metropolitanus TaxID=2943436 RepID=UPI002445DFE1|nr:ectonucleoside triphosphate diphosphohydrolase 1-like [Paramacrobiotus metropolitanus]
MMPSGKSKPSRVAEGEKSLLKPSQSGACDEVDDENENENWNGSYAKLPNTSTRSIDTNGETVSQRRRHESNTSLPRSHVEDLQLDDTGFVGEPARPSRINRRVFLLIIIGVILGAGCIVSVVVLYFRSSYIPENYVIVMDAGSAHTKLHVFHYRGDKVNGTGYIEQKEFVECDGILLKFRNQPQRLRAAWKPCLDKAMTIIPEDRWEKTEIYVAGTAGIRNLRKSDSVAADRLLSDVRDLLNETFHPHVTGERLHTLILNGEEEGALAWATVNFVSKRLIPDNSTTAPNPRLETFGSLDLGGSSTQIAFAVPTNGAGSHLPPNFDLTFFGTRYGLFSRSFACRGKGEALRTLKAQLVIDHSSNNFIKHPCLPRGSVSNESHKDLFDAQCTVDLRKPTRVRTIYAFNGTGDIKQCRQLVKTLFRDVNCPFRDTPDCSFNTRQKVNITNPFMGFAGLFFVMDFFNLTDNVHTVNVQLEHFRQAYRHHCETPWLELQNSTNPFMKGYCFDGIYIDMLLTEVYGFTAEMFERIQFRKAINGVATGWAVGLALNSTNAVQPEHEVEMMSRAFFLIFLVVFAVFLVLAVSFLCRGVRRSCRDSSI